MKLTDYFLLASVGPKVDIMMHPTWGHYRSAQMFHRIFIFPTGSDELASDAAVTSSLTAGDQGENSERRRSTPQSPESFTGCRGEQGFDLAFQIVPGDGLTKCFEGSLAGGSKIPLLPEDIGD